ncbi:phage tail protein [Paenibacillus wenxiniae]|uniref:Phage tail protein n=1 Tax=Paenibacillus wenxiniae TaxID=1636843 RepID=A0ABW4RHB3_9BACL
MKKSYVTIYNLQMQKVAFLENAFDISYNHGLNEVWTSNFSLPADDEKNQWCQPFYFAEVFDNDERLELYRIIKVTTDRQSSGPVKKYECEQVLATLLDDLMFGYHTVGNLGYYTADVIRYILNQQIVRRWQLGRCEFTRQFEYNWENQNLLGALFSVANPFTEQYQWVTDTTTTPWTLHLIKPDDTLQSHIRYATNMQGISKVEDASKVVTLMIGLGYGEGVNQLTFADINGGLRYVRAEQSIVDRYGWIVGLFVDKRIEYAETLLANTQSNLDEAKIPLVTYSVSASEIYRLTGNPVHRFQTGTVVRVMDEELGIDIQARVVKKSKSNVLGAPGDVTLEIANKTQDIASSLADVRNRQYVNDVYSQGATNVNVQDFDDNIDFDHPGVIEIYVPDQTVRINSMMLSYQLLPYEYHDETGIHVNNDFTAEFTYINADNNSIRKPDGDQLWGQSAEIDLVKWLETDDSGKVTRGKFHKIQFSPVLQFGEAARLKATIVTQYFVQSRGGGSY